MNCDLWRSHGQILSHGLWGTLCNPSSGKIGQHLNIMPLTALFKGSDMPNTIGRTFTGARRQFWLEYFPTTTSDS